LNAANKMRIDPSGAIKKGTEVPFQYGN